MFAQRAMTDEVFSEMLEKIASGLSLSEVCRLDRFPCRVTFYRWIDGDLDRCNRYARACELRQEKLFDEMIQIADRPLVGVERKRVFGPDDADGEKCLGYEEKERDAVERSRLMIETRKWALAKMAPKKYGDKVEVGIGAEGGGKPAQMIISFVGGDEQNEPK